MSYTIIKSDGTTLGAISDGTKNETLCSLTLIGRNYPNYGAIIANDMVHLLENWASDANNPPGYPLAGQLWWDKTNSILKVNKDGTASGWKIVGSAYPAPNNNPPPGPVQGDLWWDTTYSQLNVYDATNGWTVVGPQRNNSGAIWEQIIDDINVPHDVLSIKLDGIRTSIVSTDDTFTPANAIAGYTTIKAGINANTLVGTGTYWGVADDANMLGGYDAVNYFRNNKNNSGTGNLRVLNDDGVVIGANLDLSLQISSGDASVQNNTSGGDISLYTNVPGQGSLRSLYISGQTGNVSVIGKPVTALGVATKNYVDDSFTNSPSLGGIPTAPNASPSTNTNQIATTAVVYEANIGLQGYVNFANVIQSQQIQLRANIADPTFTGNVRAPTAINTENSTILATTAFVQTANVLLQGYVDSRDALKANIASPTFTGIPAADTAAAGTNTTQLATTAFVYQSNVGLKSYVDFANTIQSQQINLRATIASPTFTGIPAAVTAAAGTNTTQLATTAFVYEANVGLKNYVDAQDALKAPLASPSLTGLPRAITMPLGTANTTIATTEFVANYSGLYPYKIYQNNTWMWVNDTGVGTANIVVDGTSVLTATVSGVNLTNGATAVTQTQTYNASGNTRIATTQYVKTATQWWGGSAKWVSTDEPSAGVNDIGSNDGDFWFQREL